MEYAGLWRRVIAILVDSILFLGLYFLLEYLVKNSFYTYWIYQTLCVSYYVGLTASPYQATIGQLLFKIKIRNADGDQLTLSQAFLRFVLWISPSWPIVIYAGLPHVLEMTDALNEVQGNEIAQNKIVTSPEFAAHLRYYLILVGLGLSGGIVWMMSIALSKEKAGIHDKICGQRAFKVT